MRRLLLVALTVHAAGAIGVEAVNRLLRELRWLYYVTGTTVEEALEMAACILAIGAFVNHLTTVPDGMTRHSLRGRWVSDPSHRVARSDSASFTQRDPQPRAG